jgi:hypothetical protein
MTKGRHKDKIRKIEQDFNERAKPSSRSQIVISPSNLKTRGTPLWMRSLQANAMNKETERYRGASTKDNGQDLCVGILPLEDSDGFPKRMALILDTDGIAHTEGKPCPSNSLKSSPYCRSCKKALNTAPEE